MSQMLANTQHSLRFLFNLPKNLPALIRLLELCVVLLKEILRRERRAARGLRCQLFRTA